jgi:Arc/MetJ-type ribon-helix-helix transcriptional regulator
MERIKFKLEKTEEEALDYLVKVGLFSNRDEAARAAILKYAMDIGVLDRRALWQKMGEVKRRKVTPDRLVKDLETLEDEI